MYHRICLLLLLLLPGLLKAQPAGIFRFDMYHGLPSNNAYGAATDAWGYLWIYTTNGIIRYSGYRSELFTVNNGLPNSDVWGLIPDNQKRLWVFSIADRIGYISNGRYHRAYIHGEDADVVLYPRALQDLGPGILLAANCSKYNSNNWNNYDLYIEKNDTLRKLTLYGDMLTVSRDSSLLVERKKILYQYRYVYPGRLQLQRAFRYPSFILTEVQKQIFGSWLLCICGYEKTIWAYQPETHQLKALHFGEGQGDDVVYVYPVGNDLMVVGTKGIYRLDTLLRQKPACLVKDYFPDTADGRIHTFSMLKEDSLWGSILTTRTDGTLLFYPNAHSFQRQPGPDLTECVYIGKVGDSLAYWWRNVGRMLVEVKWDGQVKWIHSDSVFDAVRIISYSATHSYLLTKNLLYRLRHSDHSVTRAMETSSIVPHNGALKGPFVYSRDMVLYDSSRFFLTGDGLNEGLIRGKHLMLRVCNRAWLKSLIYDRVRNIIWAFNNDVAYFMKLGDSLQGKIQRKQLRAVGIQNLEAMAVDDHYGNLFVKDQLHLFSVDIAAKKVERLFANYNLSRARLLVEQDKIIVAGKFGVLFCKIRGKGRFGPPVVYNNVRNSHFYEVNGLATLKNRVFLQTDQGLCTAVIPSDSLLSAGLPGVTDYRLLISCRDSLFRMGSGDTLSIMPGQTLLSLDLINPLGNGTPRFRYRVSGMDGGWTETSGSELVLPNLLPGQYYTLSVVASDDVWRGDPQIMVLYMVPRWWQKPAWKLIFWIGGVVLLLFLLLGVALLTNYYGTRKAKRKELMLSLELRAIYAQINPHFIFNSLNTALYFIRKAMLEEAVVHVVRFSHLLRAYLESSRKRYISVQDEIVNINNYIELQQTRFVGLFDCEIKNELHSFSWYIPTFLVQPFVENAINHGLVPRGGQGGLLLLEFRQDEDGGLVCIIDDNGVGRRHVRGPDPDAVHKRESYGNKLMEEMIRSFNRHDKMGIEIVYYDKEPPLSGTRVTISIKKPRYEP